MIRDRLKWFAVGALTAALLTVVCQWSPLSRAAPDAQALKVQGPDSIGTLLPVDLTPPGAASIAPTLINQSSANAAAANNLSFGAVVGVTNYCTGFAVTGGGATAASVINIQVTGSTTTNLQYQLAIPAGAAVGVQSLIVNFTRPISATGPNVALGLTVPSFGAGNTAAAAALYGFRQ